MPLITFTEEEKANIKGIQPAIDEVNRWLDVMDQVGEDLPGVRADVEKLTHRHKVLLDEVERQEKTEE